MDDNLRELLTAVSRGETSIETALTALAAREGRQQTEDACVDVDRQRRCGYPEVVYCQGKSGQAVVEIFEVLHSHGQDCLGTRLQPEHVGPLVDRFPGIVINEAARTARLMTADPQPETGCVCVVSAGTSDAPVAAEAVETLVWMRCGVDQVVDVGVAGPHRLAAQAARLAAADAVVVVAGMEGALPSVVGGHVACPVIAVPTSVGYGANLNGIAALLAMLNSCAANVAVVNIDAGFKAGYVAGLIARKVAGARQA